MAFQHGKSGYWSINDGSERDLSTFLTEVSFPRELDLAETTTFGSTFKTNLAGVTDATMSISGFWDPTATTGPDAVLAGVFAALTARVIIYGPYGNTGGQVKYTFSAICTSYEVSGSVDGAVEFSAEFQLSTAVSRTTF